MRQKFLPIIVSLFLGISLLAFFNYACTPSALAADDSEPLDLWSDPVLNEANFGAEQLNEIGLGRKDPREIATRIIQIALGLLGIIAVAIIMYGGYVWMTAQGDADKVETAQKILRNGVVGLLIVLAAFGLATYIINRLLYSTGGSGGWSLDGNGSNQGLGALGNGIVKSVYPEPGATDVPRNTIIMITFREAMQPNSFCQPLVNGACSSAGGSQIVAENLRIFQSQLGDGEANLTDVFVDSQDNKTFVLTPRQPLGSQAEPIDYTVYLSTDIKKANNDAAFSLSGFAWSFEVGTDLDLTPPKIVSIFPGPDNAQDQAGSVTPAVAAHGAVEVAALPKTERANSVSYRILSDGSPAIDIANPNDNTCNGTVEISINNSSPLTANIAYNMTGYVDNPQAAIIDNQLSLACGTGAQGLIVEFANGYSVGQAWALDLQTAQRADILVVGSQSYSFVAANPGDRQILIDSNLGSLAQNIRQALSDHGQVSVKIDPANGRRLLLTAKVAGGSGNNIILASSNEAALIVNPMSGGANQSVATIVVDKPDKPKNAIIQINFSEAVNPLHLVGPAADVNPVVIVTDLNTNQQVSGDFVLSNQYRTLEFIPNLECGVNGCGETVYCLPANSQIRVDMLAAELLSSCSGDGDCLQAPFTKCQAGVCTNPADNKNQPAGQVGSGVADSAGNSLDGNRNNSAQGPVSYYSANDDNTSQGDNFRWSFWISDILDLTSPKILSINVGSGQAGVNNLQVIEVQLDKLLMSETIKTGSVIMKRGEQTVVHQLVNLWSLSGRPLGYWTTKQDTEASTPPDSEPDQTMVQIRHAALNDATQYRAHLGSGLKDIYQNCYKPSGSSSCPANSLQPSCCDEVPTASSSCH